MIASAAANGLRDRLRPLAAPIGSLGVRGLGVAAGFALTVIIGRYFGPVANGQYALITQSAIFLATIAIGGLDLAVAREFPKAGVEGRPISRWTIAKVLGQSVALALALTVIVSLVMTRWLSMPDLPANALLLLCLILLSRTLTRMIASILRSQSQFLSSQAVEMLLVPLLTLAVIALGPVRSIADILIATAIGGFVTVIVGLAGVWKRTSSGNGSYSVSLGTLYATAWPLWGVAIAQNFSDWYGLATITAIGGLAETGIYRVASQFAMAFSIVTLALFGTYATGVSAACHEGDRQAAARIAGQATALSLALVTPLAIGCLLFAEWLLGLVGPEYASKALVLQILVCGQLAFTVAGAASMVLAMSGHPRVNLWINLASMMLIVASAPLFVRSWGAEGLAACLSTMMVLKAVACVIAVRRLQGIDVLRGRLLKQFATD